MATETAARTTRRLPRAARREAIMAGAAAAFARGGYAATSVQDLAAATGVTPLILYRHFASKEALYRAVLGRVARRHEAALGADGDPAGFGVGARPLLAVAREDPDGFALLWRHAMREPNFASYADALREQAVAASRARLAPLVPAQLLDWASHATLGFLVEAVLTWLEHGDPTRDDAFVGAVNAALRAGAAAWSDALGLGPRRHDPRA